jgi:bifunctional enzyme CysN/CysC
MSTAPFPIVIVGHVDHGKSTLIGRLLYDTDSLPEGRVAELRAVSAQRGLEMEWSFLLDALQVERDQGITVDTTRIWFRTPVRPYMIIDAPGHREFLRNMVTGAAGADAAVLVADAERGAGEQTRRHAFLLSLLGVRQVVVAINKMDRVGHSEAGWEKARDEIAEYLRRVGLNAVHFIPLSARHGDNIASRSDAMPWWKGPTLLEALDQLPVAPSGSDLPLRLPVQDVYRRGDHRIAVGRIEAGRLRVGDRVVLAPSGQTATVAALEGWQAVEQLSAQAGQSVAIRFVEDVAIARGQVVAAPGSAPTIADRLSVRAFWLDTLPLRAGDRLSLRLGTGEHAVRVARIDRVVDIQHLVDHTALEVGQGGIAEIVLDVATPIAVDLHASIAVTGRAALSRDGRISGGCVVLNAERSGSDQDARRGPVTAVTQSVSRVEIAERNGHQGGVVWLTGLSGAGKSTVAMAARRSLFERGWQTAVLDGDNLRTGLNADLGFSPEDRQENVRRTAELARTMAEAGLLVIVSLITPTEALRNQAAEIVTTALGAQSLLRVWARADLATCSARDPKGLYRKALSGELPGFTGVSAPFEEPAATDLILETGTAPLTDVTDLLVTRIADRFGSVGTALRREA